jgi:hypothetical protein
LFFFLFKIQPVQPTIGFTKGPSDGPIHTVPAPNLGSNTGHQSTDFFGVSDLSAPVDNHIDTFQFQPFTTPIVPQFTPTPRPVCSRNNIMESSQLKEFSTLKIVR